LILAMRTLALHASLYTSTLWGIRLSQNCSDHMCQEPQYDQLKASLSISVHLCPFSGSAWIALNGPMCHCGRCVLCGNCDRSRAPAHRCGAGRHVDSPAASAKPGGDKLWNILKHVRACQSMFQWRGGA
jgi:hypothetical protein